MNDDAPAIGRMAIAEIARGFMRDFPDMTVTFDKLESCGDATAFHWTLIGTNSGPGGIGNRVRISGYELWKISDEGLIAESRGHFDAAEYERQLERPACLATGKAGFFCQTKYRPHVSKLRGDVSFSCLLLGLRKAL